DEIIAKHDRAYFERVQDWGTDTELPVFIVGMPRSGSTLVEQILASHLDVFGAGELADISTFVEAPPSEPGMGPCNAGLIVDQRSAKDTAARFLQRIANLGKGAARVTIKTLENYVHFGLITTLFRRAPRLPVRIIHCRRDPFDVCLSCYFQNFRGVSFA